MTPDTFQHELDVRFGTGVLRLRHSAAHETWCIEQKVGRGTYEVPYTLGDDRAIRVHDGYALVAEVTTVPYVKCPTCRQHVPVKPAAFAEVRCAYCNARGEHEMFFVGHFPLCDRLLTHIEKTSPKRGDVWKREMDDKNAALAAEKRRDYENYTDAVMTDWFPQIAGIEQVGAGRDGKLGNEAYFKRLQ